MRRCPLSLTHSLFSLWVYLYPRPGTCQVVSLCYGGLRLLSAALSEAERNGGGLPEYILSELRRMAELSFKYAEPSQPLDLVKALAGRMHLYEPSALLSSPYEWPDARQGKASTLPALSGLLSALTPANGCVVLVGADGQTSVAPAASGRPPAAEAAKVVAVEQGAGECAAEEEGERWQTERWYATRYALDSVSGSTLEGWARAMPHPRLRLPPPNPYVPEDLQMILPPPSGATPSAPRAPARLTPPSHEEAQGARVWHLDTGHFDRPRASALLLLRTPLVSDTTPASAVLTELACQMLSDVMTTPLASCAPVGLGWAVSPHAGGLLVQAGGYSQRLPRLSLDLAASLAAFSPDHGRFELLREQLSRALRNRAQERPLWHAQYAVSHALTLPTVHHDEARAFVDSAYCTAEAVGAHLRAISRSHFAELLVHGNLPPSAALELSSAWRHALSENLPELHAEQAALPSDCAPLPQTTLLPAGGPTLRLRGVASHPDEVNSAIELHLQVAAEPTLRQEALLLLLSQVDNRRVTATCQRHAQTVV